MRNVIQLCLALVFANNILLMRKRHYVFLILLLAIAVNACKMAERFASRRYSLKNKLGDRMIKQLLNSVIAKYRDFSVSRRSIIICLSLRLGQIIATDKSQGRNMVYPRPIDPYFLAVILIPEPHFPQNFDPWALIKELIPSMFLHKILS